MKLARYVYLALLVIALLALGVWLLLPGQADADRGESKVPPRFVVDPDWPKQLPNNRSEEHTSELQSQSNLVCRLLLEKKKTTLSSIPSVFSIIRANW